MKKKIFNFIKFLRYKNFFREKNGIEIGGPSYHHFKKRIPIYKVINKLDNVNFSSSSYWEGSNIKTGKYFNYYKNEIGYQYICEATNMYEIRNEKYDFLLSSNCLEHIANPLKAIKEWTRIIKNMAYIFIIVPNKKSNFDHKRPFTKFDHVLSDFKNNIEENDLSHLDEILSFHDLSKDLAAGSYENFKTRSLKNYQNRFLHHHVFNLELLEQSLIFFKYRIVDKFEDNSDFYILGQKNN